MDRGQGFYGRHIDIFFGRVSFCHKSHQLSTFFHKTFYYLSICVDEILFMDVNIPTKKQYRRDPQSQKLEKNN